MWRKQTGSGDYAPAQFAKPIQLNKKSESISIEYSAQ